MRIVALDIETIPDPDAMAVAVGAPPEFSAPSNWKDPEKIAAAVAEKRDAWMGKLSKTLATDPLTAQVVSVALFSDLPGAGPQGAVATLADMPAHTEAELLRWTWGMLALFDAVATFNGVSFDGPTLQLRSARYGITPTLDLTTRRGAYAPNCDVFEFVTQNRRPSKDDEPGTKLSKRLEAVCAYAGVPFSKGGMDGSQVAEYAADGRWDEIGRYNLGDAEATWRLYERLRGVIPGHVDPRAIEAARTAARRAALGQTQATTQTQTRAA